MLYSVPEIRRIARVGFETARKRGQQALLGRQGQRARHAASCGARSSRRSAADYPDVALSHMYVDNAAMQLVRNPKQFDVIVTGNIFGDILSDEASMLAGSIGMLPSASLDAERQGTLRADPRLGAGHRRPGQGQSAGDDPVAGDDVPLHVRARRRRRAHRARGARVLAQGCAPPTSRCPASTSIGTRAMGDAVRRGAAKHECRRPSRRRPPRRVARRRGDARDLRGAEGDGRHAAAAVSVAGNVAQAARRCRADRLPAGRDQSTARSSATSGCTRRRSRRAAGTPAHSACRCATTGRVAASARALMRAALDLADDWLNYQRLELTVYTDNLPASRCTASSASRSRARARVRVSRRALRRHVHDGALAPGVRGGRSDDERAVAAGRRRNRGRRQ